MNIRKRVKRCRRLRERWIRKVSAHCAARVLEKVAGYTLAH